LSRYNAAIILKKSLCAIPACRQAGVALQARNLNIKNYFASGHTFHVARFSLFDV